MAKAGTEITSTSYIDHHLTNLICGKTDKGWTCDPYLADQMGFWSFHVDSLGWSVFLGLVFVGLFKLGTSRLSSEAPSGLQNFVEMCVEFVNENVQSIFTSAKNPIIGPMALTVLIWVFLMNLMDLVPVDYLPTLAANFATYVGLVDAPRDAYFKVVPTTDPNITLGMALAVFILIIFYSIKIKGFKGFVQSGPEVLEADADILIPAAMELVITDKNAKRIKAPLIIEAANGPISSSADEILVNDGKK